MNFHVLTLFPDMIRQGVGTSITGRAIRQDIIKLNTVNIRDFSQDKNRRVDDYTYGGGAGMLMQAQPVYDAWKQVRDEIPEDHKVRTIYVTPQGTPFRQRMAEEFARQDDLIFLCGHYEGIDERVLEEVVTDYVSIGDYVLTGGELASMVMIDAISRLVPGVLHNEVSADTESFHAGLLEYPQYSRPEVWHGRSVPKELLGGSHKEITVWRQQQAIKRTRERRPDLYQAYEESERIRSLLMKDKRLHIDMISAMHQGSADRIPAEESDILLYDPMQRMLLAQSMREEGLSGMAVEEIRRLIGSDRLERVVLHKEADAKRLADLLQQDYRICLRPYVSSLLTRREKLPVMGLYRPDGKPSQIGLVICPVETGSREQAAEARLESRKVGEIHITADRRIYGLWVEEGNRRRHIGMALETWALNRILEEGIVPYAWYSPQETEAAALQDKLGLFTAKTCIFIIDILKSL